MSDQSSQESGWQERTYGLLPAGSKVRPVDVISQTSVEHGELTWTAGQTVRDILQNHLDANTQVFFDQLVSAVIDTDKLKLIKDETNQQNFDEFTYWLFLYRKSLADLSAQTEQEFAALFNQFGQGLPIKEEYLLADGKINLPALKKTIEPINEVLPTIRYHLVDQTNPGFSKWVDLAELQSSEQYRETTTNTAQAANASEQFRYQIVGIQIIDQGSGFDAKLTTFYKSTKVRKRHLRGRFGEGLKLSQAYLLRKGARIKTRSGFHINDEFNRDRVWQQRAYINEEKLRMKGIEVDLPPDPTRPSGSFTLIDIQNADPDFCREFRQNIDPRTDGWQTNCLLYSPIKYHYASTQPVGVSLEAEPKNQYVQDLKIPKAAESFWDFEQPVFSYDFLDSSVLGGRDRNVLLKDEVKAAIKRFWQTVDSADLLKQLFCRTLLDKKFMARRISSPEYFALADIFSYFYNNSENPPIKRAQEILFQILPKFLNLSEGQKYVVVSWGETKQPENQRLIETLKRLNYQIITLNQVISFDQFNQYHQEKFSVFTLSQIKSVIGKQLEISPEEESLKRITEIYQSAREQLEVMLNQTDLGNLANLAPEPIYIQSLTDDKEEEPIELVFDQQTGKFRLKIRPALIEAELADPKNRDYWRRRMQVLMLAVVGRKKGFVDILAAYQTAQENVNYLLGIMLGKTDLSAISTDFAHQLQTDSEIKVGKDEELIKQQLLGLAIFDKIFQFSASLADLAEAIENYPNLPKDYQDFIATLFHYKVFVEGEEIGYAIRKDFSGNFVLERKKIADLTVAGKLDDGRPIYQIGNRYLVCQSIPDGSVIKVKGKDGLYVLYGGRLFKFKPSEYFQQPLIFDKPVVLGVGCLVSNGDSDLEQFKTAIEDLEIIAPVTIAPEMKKLGKTIIATDLPVDYGQGRWDDPVRVFEDMVQNHLDAGKTTLAYEVLRDGQRRWVGEDELTSLAKIIGIKIMDDGAGYAPDDLATMGKSSKKHPFFAGKYGEGQKMIAAPAVRNGFELSFSSKAFFEGQPVRWTAAANTQEEEVFVDGKKKTIPRVVFQLSSNAPETDENFSSATTLRLTDLAQYDTADWQNWLAVIDPRQKDEKGNSGLARYAIDLRKDDPNVIDLGFMRILLDELGAVYENGLLVTKNEKLVVGYDVPWVTAGRDRNQIDQNMLQEYISKARLVCRDLRYFEALLQHLKNHYEEQFKFNVDSFITESDLSLISNRPSLSVVAKPFWKMAAWRQLPGYYIYSEEALRKRIKIFEEAKRESWGLSLKEEANKARITLANIRHVPGERLINVSDLGYSFWSLFLPTAEEYVLELMEQKAPASSKTLQELAKVLASSTERIAELIKEMEADEGSRITLECIISGLTPAEAAQETGKAEKDQVDRRIAF